MRVEMHVNQKINFVSKAELIMVFKDGREEIVEATIVDKETGVIEAFVKPNDEDCLVYTRLTFPHGGCRLHAHRAPPDAAVEVADATK